MLTFIPRPEHTHRPALLRRSVAAGMGRASVSGLAGLLVGVLFGSGCSQKPAPVYASQEAAKPTATTSETATIAPLTVVPSEPAPGETDIKVTDFPVAIGDGYRAGSAYGLSDVFFEFDSDALGKEQKDVLARNARVLTGTGGPSGLVRLVGFCDVRGTEKYNMGLGERRAHAVKEYLVALGVDPSRLESISVGKTEEWARGASESAYRQNRRAHFTIAPRKAAPAALRSSK